MEFGVKEPNSDYTSFHSLDQGAIVKISGRIRAHDEYRSEKQTVITRCKYEVVESKERDRKVAEMNDEYNRNKDYNCPWEKDFDDLLENCFGGK